MSRRRGRPSHQYRLRIRTVRRDPIDYDALARAALEQAAMNQADDPTAAPTHQNHRKHLRDSRRSKDRRHDGLA